MIFNDAFFSTLARECSGLKPKAWAVLGSGFVREDLKTELLMRGAALTGESVFGLSQWLGFLLDVAPERILPASARMERLRALLSNPSFLRYFDELKRNKRQSGFFRKLDKALQGYRLVAAHPSEHAMMDQLAIERTGQNPYRKEVAVLDAGWQAALVEENWWDLPRLLDEARDRLEQGVSKPFPERLYRLSAQIDQGLEASFWEAVARHTQVITVFDPAQFAEPASVDATHISGLKAHTVDELADATSARLAGEVDRHGVEVLKTIALVIPDVPYDSEVRRSLARALAITGLEFLDPRDPGFLRESEGLKHALLPLELVSSRYPAERVSAFVRDEALNKRLEDAAIVQGLNRYKAPGLEAVFDRLSDLEARFGEKQNAREFKRRHLTYLAEQGLTDDRILAFLDAAWDQVELDVSMSGRTRNTAPLSFWFERIREKAQTSTPPALKLRPEYGVELFRVSQLPPREFEQVIFFNIPADQFDPKRVGDYAFSDREREVLSTDIASLKSARRDAGLRLAIARLWAASAKTIQLADALYLTTGGEHAGSEFWAKEVLGSVPSDWMTAEVPAARLSSWGPALDTPPSVVRIPAAVPPQGSPLKASQLDTYVKCGFLGWARNTLKAENLERASTELRRRQRGDVLHFAANLAIKQLQAGVEIDPTELVAEAWSASKMRGLYRSAAIEAHHKKNLTRLIEIFIEKERAFRSVSAVRTIHFDDLPVRLQLGPHVIEGRPDRVDEHEQGLLVWDYKSASSAFPSGPELVDQGQAVQLLVYAAALRRERAREVVAAGYIQFSSDNKRTSGVYFKAHNGKTGVTNYRSNAKGLLDESPEEVWARAEATVLREVERLMSGDFDPKPKDPKICDRCDLAGACGYHRRREEGEGDEQEA